MDRREILEKLLSAAAAASEVVLGVYGESDVGVEMKGPNDPVTRADKLANALLLERLAKDFPGIPLVAEESDPSTYADFGKAPCAIFVDPVDGTREFIEKNGEFAVMLGFAEEGRATVGVVDCPAFGQVFAGAEGVGAFRIDGSSRVPIAVSAVADLAECRCAVSRFRRSKSVQDQLALLGVKEMVPIGGAGIKGVRVAAGEIEIYCHPSRGPVKLWDACAPEAVVRAAGGLYTDANGRSFDYRGPIAQGEGALSANPTLHAIARQRLGR